jgi:hypothetical protein
MKLNERGSSQLTVVKKISAIAARKDKTAPDRGTHRPARPDRGGGNPRPGTNRPPRPDRGFENDLPGEPIVPPDADEMPGEVIVPDDVTAAGRMNEER